MLALYERVRPAMQQNVRDAIAKQGFGLSHIIVPEALLKLSQVCSDPKRDRYIARYE